MAVAERELNPPVMEIGLDEPSPSDPVFVPRAFRAGDVLAVQAPTWEMSPKVTFDTFLQLYRKNPGQALRELGSVASSSEEPFFRDPDILDIRANVLRTHPFTREAILSDRTDDQYLSRRLRTEFVPQRSVSYFLHVDTSKSRDATGIAMAHWDKTALRDVKGIGLVTGQIVVDFMIRVEAPPNEDIHYEGIRTLIQHLKERGFAIRLITFDSFNSLDMQQILRKRGFAVDELSVDRKTDAYDTLQELLLLGKLDYYPYPIFIDECKQLEVRQGKIDHRVKHGSKDVADATAACVYLAREFAGIEVYAATASIPLPNQESDMFPSADETKFRNEILGYTEIETVW